MKRRVYEKAGLVYSGKNEDGEMEFIGNDKQWEEAERMWDEFCNHDCVGYNNDCKVCRNYLLVFN